MRLPAFPSVRRRPGSGERRLPTFLVIGAMRSGTTTLYDALRRHPSVYMSKVKEPFFFAFEASMPRSENDVIPKDVMAFRTLDDYATLFAGAPPSAKAIGEASSGYLCTMGTAEVIRASLPDVKLIAVLRDPVERAWSEYRVALHRKLGRGTFDDVLENVPGILACGEYARLIRRYLEVFPRDQLLILLTEDLAREPGRVVDQACEFIGVEPGAVRVKRRNRGPVTIPMPTTIRDRLVAHYRADVLDLEGIIGRDLSHWLNPPVVADRDARDRSPRVVSWIRARLRS